MHGKQNEERQTLFGRARLVRKLLELATHKLEDLEKDLKDPNALRRELGDALDMVTASERKLEDVVDLYLEAERSRHKKANES